MNVKELSTEQLEHLLRLSKAAREAFGTAGGRMLLDYWEQEFVRKPPLPSQTEQEVRTNAGKALFVLGIHATINNAEAITLELSKRELSK